MRSSGRARSTPATGNFRRQGQPAAGRPALARAARGAGIDIGPAYPDRAVLYPLGRLRLNFSDLLGNEPHPREDQAIAWQEPGAPRVAPMLPANAPVLASLALPDEYAITNAGGYGIAEMLARLERRPLQGLKMLQVREPGWTKNESSSRSHRARASP
jgi:hypothetical protein